MPVDTSAINTILGAYAQGAQIRQRQEAQKFAEQEAIAQQTLRRQQLEEETKRAEAALKQRQEEQKATNTFRERQLKMQEAANKLAQIGAKSQITEHIQKTGVTPAGFKRDIDWMSPDGGDVWFKYTSEEDPTFSFVLPSQITQARDQAAIQTELMKPQMRMEAAKAGARMLTEAAKQQAIHNSKMLIEGERTKRQEASDKAAYDRAMAVAKVKARSAKTPEAKTAALLEKPLTREDIAELNRANPDKPPLQFGARASDAVGRNVLGKLSVSAANDLRDVDEVENAATKLKELISKNEAAFKEYFKGKGASGMFADVGRKFETKTTPTLAEARRLIGTISTRLGHKDFGASFTGGEKEQLRTYVPHVGRDQIYEEFITQLNGLLDSAKRSRRSILAGQPVDPIGNSEVRTDKVNDLVNDFGGRR